MDNKDPDVELFVKAIYRERHLYDWHRSSVGHDVQQIEEHEEGVYTDIWEDVDRETLWQRDIDELQLLLSLADPAPRANEAFVTKKRFYSLQDTHLTMDSSKNHSRPHFHLRYKNEHSASYAIDNLQCL